MNNQSAIEKAKMLARQAPPEGEFMAALTNAYADHIESRGRDASHLRPPPPEPGGPLAVEIDPHTMQPRQDKE